MFAFINPYQTGEAAEERWHKAFIFDLRAEERGAQRVYWYHAFIEIDCGEEWFSLPEPSVAFHKPTVAGFKVGAGDIARARAAIGEQ